MPTSCSTAASAANPIVGFIIVVVAAGAIAHSVLMWWCQDEGEWNSNDADDGLVSHQQRGPARAGTLTVSGHVSHEAVERVCFMGHETEQKLCQKSRVP